MLPIEHYLTVGLRVELADYIPKSLRSKTGGRFDKGG